MKVQIGEMAVEVELTGLQKRMLAAGNSVAVNLYPDPDQREYTVEDMGFRPGRVHVDSVNHPNPAVDPKKLVEQMDKVIGHESKYNYPRIEDQQERAKEYAKRRYGSEEAYTEFYRKRPTLDERLTVNTGFDPISHPAHYTEGRKHEPKDVIRDWGLNFNLGSAVKYLSRSGRKDAAITDLEKAKTFIQFEIDALKKEGEE